MWGTPKKWVIFFLIICLFFSSDYVYPQELECLQDHLEDLLVDCREVVGNLTELESEVGGN